MEQRHHSYICKNPDMADYLCPNTKFNVEEQRQIFQIRSLQIPFLQIEEKRFIVLQDVDNY